MTGGAIGTGTSSATRMMRHNGGLPPPAHKRASPMPAPGMHSGVATDDALNLSMSEHAVPLYEAVKAFIKNEIDPITEEYYRLGEGRPEKWGYGAGQLELLDSVKAKAKAN